MKKTKFNPQLLAEELKRFKMINEYSFGTKLNSDNAEDDLLLGYNLKEEDENPEDSEADAISNELGIPPEGDTPAPDAPAPDASGDMGAPTGDVPPAPAPAPAPAPEMDAPAEDEVEVDITELVDSSNEAEHAAKAANRTSHLLLKKLEDLEARIAKMDAVGDKIDNLEKEIIKRNPSNVEKLEMQSLNSYPYSQKLTDYWADKTGQYDVTNNEPKEYTLTQDDVDSDFNEGNISKSFTVKDSDFEEEDI